MKHFLKKIQALLKSKKNGCILLIAILPFIIVISIFSFYVIKDVKDIIDINGETGLNEKYVINDGDYILRSNATEYQLELFGELKELLESNTADEIKIAESICKNYVADFYTWSNKYGQYDVGGMYFVYSPQKNTIYIQARDEFYKYINEYINKYKKDNLLQVSIVKATACRTNNYVSLMDNLEFDAYSVECEWEYLENEVFKTDKYAKKINFIVINNNGRYEIVEAYE